MPDNNENKNVNIHSGHRERMRKKLLKHGIGAFEDHEILEFLLFYVNKQKDTNPIGHKLIDKFKSLEAVFGASFNELCSVDGINEVGAALIMLVGALPNRLSLNSAKQKAHLGSHREAAEFCSQFFKGLDYEKMIVVSVNSAREVLAVDEVSTGTTNATSVDIRKILEIALLRKATGIILAHNHPSDSPHPSAGDTAVTTRIISVLEGINISVIDHIICSNDSYSSMSERGLLDTL